MHIKTGLFAHPAFLLIMRGVAIIFALAVLAVSLEPGGVQSQVQYMDKVLHAVVYGILTFITGLAWPQLRKIILFIVAVGYGGLIEVLQGLMSQGRTASIWDGVANGFGALIGLLGLYLLALSWRRLHRE